MKMTNQEIMDFANATFGDKKLPVNIAYAISKNAKTIEAAVKAFGEVRTNILESCAKKDADGKPIIEDNQYIIDDVEKFNADINELLTTETEVDIHKVHIDEFAKLDDPKFDALTVSEMAILKFMIEE